MLYPLVSFLISLVLTFLFLRIARGTSWLLAIPNDRSAHGEPVPTSGGLGFIIAGALVMIALAAQLEMPARVVLPLVLVVAGLGLADDVLDLPARLRLLLLAVVGIAVSALAGGFPPVNIGGWQQAWHLLAIPLGAVFMLYLTNIYNFMDGIDGIAAIQGIFALAVMGTLQGSLGHDGLHQLMLSVAAALAGFLVFNLPDARLFMGDVGSYGIGCLLAVLMMVTGQAEPALVWPWVIVLAVFLADSTLTLVVRWVRGENVLEAHNIHAYQHFARAYGVRRALFVVVGVMVLWLLPLAIVAWQLPTWGILFALVAYLPLLAGSWYCGAGQRISHLQG